MWSRRTRILAGSGMLLVLAGLGRQLLVPDGDQPAPITVGTTDVVSGIDPAGAYDVGSWALYSNVYQTLLTFAPGSTEPQPDAAERCAFVGGSLRTYECRLRGDLTFSNGRKVTPAAVKPPFDRVLAIRHKLCPSLLFADPEAVEVRGETVVFRLKSDDATWPSKVATGAAAIVDPAQYPADRLREARTAVGSGPYVISSFRPGSSIRLQPRASYRGAAGGKGTSIHISYFQDAAAPDAAWATEQIDVAHRGLSPKILSGPGPTAHDTRLQAMPTSEIRNLVLGVRPGSPLAKVEVRHAIAALVDRGRLATEVFEDTVEPLYSVIPKGITGHNLRRPSGAGRPAREATAAVGRGRQDDPGDPAVPRPRRGPGPVLGDPGRGREGRSVGPPVAAQGPRPQPSRLRRRVPVGQRRSVASVEAGLDLARGRSAVFHRPLVGR